MSINIFKSLSAIIFIILLFINCENNAVKPTTTDNGNKATSISKKPSSGQFICEFYTPEPELASKMLKILDYRGQHSSDIKSLANIKLIPPDSYSAYGLVPPAKAGMLEIARRGTGDQRIVYGNGWWLEMYIFIKEHDPAPPGKKWIETGGYSRISENIDYIWVRDDVACDGGFIGWADNDRENDDYVNI